MLATDPGGAPRGESLVMLWRTIAIGLALWLVLTLGVLSGATIGIDQCMMRLAKTLAADPTTPEPSVFREMLRDVTALGSFTVLTSAVLLAALYLLAGSRHGLVLLLLTSAVGAALVSTSVKIIVDRARPVLVEPGVPTFTASYPSGHALLTAAIVLPMAALLARTIKGQRQRQVVVWGAVALVIMVGLSRVALGVHWPTDVLAGWSLGAAWAAATLVVATRVSA
jgi:undecaprenyl-diphosphatase